MRNIGGFVVVGNVGVELVFQWIESEIVLNIVRVYSVKKVKKKLFRSKN